MSLTHLIILLIVGAIAGLIGERLVGRGMPGGLIGAIVAGLVGAWLMVDVLHLVLLPEFSVEGIPLLSAILGAAIVVLLLSLVAGGGRFGARGWRGL
ncbi:MAG TPA: GlsB/YeaQ/YmgE family stress response membrane protein [Candidatus Dormibacteraeota bacterium]